MAGLLLLFIIGAWFAFAIKIAITISSSIKNELRKYIITIVATAIILVAPVTDDIIGTVQFSSYCKSQIIKTYASIPVDHEFYTETGAWLLGEPRPSSSSKEYDERRLLVGKADSYVRWESKDYVPMPGILLIKQRPTKIYAKESRQLLAEWNSYAYEGGILRSTFLGYTNECHPYEEGYGLYKKIFHRASL